ncbi:GNAT family N-acetyltransferase [Oceanobacillus iheyensis]|uniref:GNAT family N-acetyltransferase n=1 Tax=Oceanobacillus iheyensis TaxID=182710 RepID=UPI00059FB038|nr:GNAT family protein [Oceanobacillus iheyensis]
MKLPIPDLFLPYPRLDTNRLFLRQVEESDTEDIFAYASDPLLTTHVTWDAHQTLQDTQNFIQFACKQYEENGVGPWAIVWKETNQVIGTIDLIWNKKHHSAELAYAISREFWRQGIGTEAIRKIIDFGFNKMELERIQARCVPENIASYRLMETVGMTYEGTLRKSMFRKGKQDDLKMYAILQSEYL